MALSVVCSHAGINWPIFTGTYAVMLFFAISGYCMALVLNEKYKPRDIFRFYGARFLRLWPTYAFVIGVFFVSLGLPLEPHLNGIISNIYFYVSALGLIGNETLWWLQASHSGHLKFVTDLQPSTLVLTHVTHMQNMWSVGVELFFYLSAPFYARSPKRILMLLPVVFIMHLAFIWFLPPTNPLQLRSGMAYFWIFLLGMASYWGGRIWPRYLRQLQFQTTAMTCVALALVIALIVLQQPYYFNGNHLWLRIDIGILIFCAALIPLFESTRHARFDRSLGELSYPIYVVHWPLLQVFALRFGPVDASIGCFLILVLTAAATLRLLIERPIDRFRALLANGSRRPQQFEAAIERTKRKGRERGSELAALLGPAIPEQPVTANGTGQQSLVPLV
ncbi:MAG: acyltransferase [Proteobacteria bacterium]|nr:acyltransferase [Pseudomonadota bacterium]